MKLALLRLACLLGHCALLALAFAPMPAAAAGETVAPAPAPFSVLGFRSARFGMAETDVRQAIARDFPGAAGGIEVFDNPNEGTRVLVATTPALEPGPGAASVSYVLGARSRRLMHVNVTWTSAEAATDAERERFSVAALQFTRHFREQAAAGAVTRSGIPAGDGMLVFGARDAKGSAVEVYLSGVDLAARDGRAAATAALDKGSARLRISYVANVARPDIARVRQGDF